MGLFSHVASIFAAQETARIESTEALNAGLREIMVRGGVKPDRFTRDREAYHAEVMDAADERTLTAADYIQMYGG